VQYLDTADTWIKEELKKRGVKVEYGQNLVAIDKEKQIATFEDVRTKAQHTRPFNNLYTLIPCKAHPWLKESGLTAANGLLDVDHQTLRHNKYKNIFGVGDVCNVPTTKTFWYASNFNPRAGFYQIAVARNNVARSLQGQTLNALYDGFTKVPLFTGQNHLTYVAHSYNNVAAWHNLFDSRGGLVARMRYLYWGKN
jgi:NADPH-dependent 2,4-dienoyl-CoA reductase/sulfur reductase-like enzyme